MKGKNYRRTLRAALAVCALGFVLTACSIQKKYNVPTHTIPVAGNCDTSRISSVGAAFPLSGPEAPLGRAYLTGVELAVKYWNTHAGVSQKHNCLELLYKDTGENMHVGDRAILDLVNSETVNIMMAPYESTVVQFSGADLGLAGIPNTTASSLNAVRIRNNYPNTFVTTPSSALQSALMANYAHQQKWSRVAVVAVNDPAGREGLAAFKADLARLGGRVVGTDLVRDDGTFSSSQLAGLRADHPSGLVVIGDTLQVGQPLVARAHLGWTVPTIAPSNAADASVVSKLGAAGENGVSVLVPKAVVLSPKAKGPSDPSMAAFVKQLKMTLHVSRIKGSVIPYAQYYDGLSMIAYAANSINNTAPGNIQTYLENANYQGLLASYNYTNTCHQGISQQDMAIAPLDTLSNGFFRSASTKLTGKVKLAC